MVKIIVPLGVHPDAAAGAFGDGPGIVRRAFRYQFASPSKGGAEVLALTRELLHERGRGLIDDGVHGVESKGVDVKVGEPLTSVEPEVVAHVVGAGPIEVERIAPWCSVAIAEVRTVGAQDVALRTEVVVHHVEDHGEALLVTAVNETLQAVRSAVGVLHSEGEHAVVPPVAFSRELSDGHEFDRADAELD